MAKDTYVIYRKNPEDELLACAETLLPYLTHANDKEFVANMLVDGCKKLFNDLKTHPALAPYGIEYDKPWITAYTGGVKFTAPIKNPCRLPAAERALHRFYSFYAAQIKHTDAPGKDYHVLQYLNSKYVHKAVSSAERYVNYLKKWQKTHT